VRDFALQIGDMLVQEDIKLLVVACNTATAAALSALTERYDVPVIGVISPAVEEALRVSERQVIGVIATDGTVSSGAYREEFRRRRPAASILERSASWLVPIIERGLLARSTVEAGLAPVLAELGRGGIDTLILGCTHFPIVRDIFEAGVGPSVTVLDSAETTALAVQYALREQEIEAIGTPHHRLLATGDAAAFAERAQAMFRTSPSVEIVGAVSTQHTAISGADC
jgi:glutamate racemase